MTCASEDRNDQNKKEEEHGDSVCETTGSKAPALLVTDRSHRLRRLGESDTYSSPPSLPATPNTDLAGRKSDSVRNSSRAALLATEPDPMALHPEEVQRFTGYKCLDINVQDEEDLDDAELDANLEELSAAVARMRRLTEQIALEIQMQNKRLDYLWSKDDQQAADKAGEGLWHGTGLLGKIT